jgi:ribosome maturation protein SDO1
MQISQKERLIFTSNKFKEVANVISSKIVHPVTNRPFPVEVIEEAMKNVGFKAKMNDDTKKQAIACIRQLIRKYKIIRAKMLIILSCEDEDKETLTNLVKEKSSADLPDYEKWFISYKELQLDGNGRFQIEVVAEPSKFRDISESMVSEMTTAALEIVEEAIVNNTIGDIDEVNIMEERELKKQDEEGEEEEPEEKIGAVRQIAEMEIDRDLMASMKGGIQP